MTFKGNVNKKQYPKIYSLNFDEIWQKSCSYRHYVNERHKIIFDTGVFFTRFERNFKNRATNLVKMNYRLAFVFSYERFENALICIISIGPSTELRPIFSLPIFRKNGASLELLNIVFENSLPKGIF